MHVFVIIIAPECSIKHPILFYADIIPLRYATLIAESNQPYNYTTSNAYSENSLRIYDMFS